MGQVNNIEKWRVATKILKHEGHILFGSFANNNDIWNLKINSALMKIVNKWQQVSKDHIGLYKKLRRRTLNVLVKVDPTCFLKLWHVQLVDEKEGSIIWNDIYLYIIVKEDIDKGWVFPRRDDKRFVADDGLKPIIKVLDLVCEAKQTQFLAPRVIGCDV